MSQKYDLHHWDNSYIKNLMILSLCILKNHVFLIYDNKIPVATFQTRKSGDSYRFQKLAVSPEFSRLGIGTVCLQEIERLAKTAECKEVVCEVYDKSESAKKFYERNGYVAYGYANTLKYREEKLRKGL